MSVDGLDATIDDPPMADSSGFEYSPHRLAILRDRRHLGGGRLGASRCDGADHGSPRRASLAAGRHV